MRSRLIASLVVALCLAAHAHAQLAIAHVTVIDTTGGPSRQDATVVIRDGRIASIGDVVPKGSEVVDGRGKFLIPGLWDMHVHLSWTKESALHVLVANGVTGVFRTEAAKQPKPTPAELEESRALFAVLEEVVRVMNKGGVTMLTGSDVAASRVPGFMLQEELVLLVESGLTPLQALQAATLNPARVLKISDDFGSVDAGKIADLVLLDADPLVDIHNTQRIAAVILGGKRLKRADLDALLRKAEEMAKKESSR